MAIRGSELEHVMHLANAYGMGAKKFAQVYGKVNLGPPTAEEIQKAARGYHCPTCGAEPGRYCIKVADDGHVASKNPQRAPRRRHRVHDLRLLKYEMYGGPLS